jgi:hypothetical protein
MSYKSKQLKISIFGTHFVAHSYKSPADVIKTATKEQLDREREGEKLCDGSIKIARREVKYHFK